MVLDNLIKECKDSPLMCGILLVLLVVVIQNCVMDIGLGDYVGVETFTDFMNPDSPVQDNLTAGAPVASKQLGTNETQASVDNLSRTPSTCYPQDSLKPEDLLPQEESKAIQEFNTAQPVGEGILQGVNLLSAGSHIGVNTIGQSLRNANLQLRSEPPNPQVNVSPWMNTTIGPDLPRRPLEVGESCSVNA
uniref:Minor capsid protein P11 C-terminal conserved region domain-containing protein n=1 Tax=viral metagenome TaxID=1070528 RepID=A0A6C0BTJ3_9ZZZZ